MAIEKLDFKKVLSEKTPYTVILNSIIKNIKDPIAGFIWIYLYSNPGDWDVIKAHLKHKFNVGDDKIKDIFSYLKRSNLIEYAQPKKEKGRFCKAIVRVLCGDKFKINEPYKVTGGVKSTPPVTGGVKSTPWGQENEEKHQKTSKNIKKHRETTGGVIYRPPVDHSSGLRGLQKKDSTKERKVQNKDKSFCDKAKRKEQNAIKHDFAQMKNEKAHIEKHEERKKIEIGIQMSNSSKNTTVSIKDYVQRLMNDTKCTKQEAETYYKNKGYV